MTKEELLNSILESTGTGFCRSIGPEDLVQAAYNRAIEDAEKLSYLSEKVLNEEGQFTRIIEERDLEQLKIRD